MKLLLILNHTGLLNISFLLSLFTHSFIKLFFTSYLSINRVKSFIRELCCTGVVSKVEENIYNI